MKKKVTRQCKRLFSGFVAAAVLCSMLPVQVLAYESEPSQEVAQSGQSQSVAEVKDSGVPIASGRNAELEETCTVTFDPQDGSPFPSWHEETVFVGELVPEPEKPEREGYIFKGWFSYLNADGSPEYWDFNEDVIPPAEEPGPYNITLWADWEQACIVAFNPDDGSQYQSWHKENVRIGEKVAKPADPEREGYIFKGWFSYLNADGSPKYWDFNEDVILPAEEPGPYNITLWADWEQACIVAFDPDDGSQYQSWHKENVRIGEKVPQPTDPQREGYIFKGWFSYLNADGSPKYWDFNEDVIPPAEEPGPYNITLWADWEQVCIVAFDPQDGSIYPSWHKENVRIGEKVPQPTDPQRDGYMFKGWFSHLNADGSPEYWDFNEDVIPPAEEPGPYNITLWADWEQVCIVAFDPQDGSIYPSWHKENVRIGEKVPQPTDPQRDGYMFKGWFSHLNADGSPEYWDFNEDVIPPAEEPGPYNITLWADWEQVCIVAFDPQDGSIYPSWHKENVRIGEKVPQPADPQRDGYIFKGWYSYLNADGSPKYWNFNEDVIPPAEEPGPYNITLWANWEEDNGNGGENGGGNGGENGGGNGGENGGGNGGSGGGSGGSGGGSGGSGGGSGGSGGGSGGSGGGPSSPSGPSGGNNETPGGEPGEVPTEVIPEEQIEDEEIPLSPGDSEELDDIPQTGDSRSHEWLLWGLCGASAFGCITLRRQDKAIIE